MARPSVRFVRRWLAAAERAEAALLRLAVLCLLVLAVGQALLLTDARSWLNYTYRLEGLAYDPEDVLGALYLSRADEPVHTVTVAVVSRPSAPGVRLLLNGYAVADLAEPVAVIQVHPGDRLELDGSADAAPVRVRVVDVSPGLASPREGAEVEVRGDRRLLAEVRAR